MAQVSGWVRRSVRAAAADDDGRGGGGAMMAGVGGGGEGSVVQVRNLDLIFPRGCPDFSLRSIVVLDE